MKGLSKLLPLTPDYNQERLQVLKELFPDLFTEEEKLNPDEIAKLVEPDKIYETERYDFRWYGKRKSKKDAFTPSTATLKYDNTRSFNAIDNSHMIIEGENLEVLKVLSSAYRGQVKCIYIDPPYNTGKDFVYTDDYSDEKRPYWEQTGAIEEGVKVDTNPDTNGRFHSNWLSVMYSRLLLARQLLKPDGVIFVSIDDNEVHNLRKLMDEVFGEENFISCLTLVNNIAGRSDKKHVALTHEYIMMYSKTDEFVSLGTPLTEEQLEEYKYEDEGRKYRLQGLRKRGSNSKRSDRPKMFYPIYFDEATKKLSLDKSDFENPITILPKLSDGTDGRWRWGKDKFKENIDLLEAREVTTRQEYDVYEKVYLIQDGEEKTTKLKSFLLDGDYTYDTATTEFGEIFDTKVFNNPKSVYLLKNLIRVSNSKNEIVLDFFAGSGSTAQAVLELNEEDQGNRQFILVQIPEQTKPDSEAYKAGFKRISDITIERCKRVINGYGDNPDSIDTGFKVYKLTKSNFPRVEFIPDPENSEEDNIELFKKYIEEKEATLVNMFNLDDLMIEIALKNGFTLDFTKSQIEALSANKVFLIKDKVNEAFVCLDSDIDLTTIEWLSSNNKKKFICLENSIDTTKKWNLKNSLKNNLITI